MKTRTLSAGSLLALALVLSGPAPSPLAGQSDRPTLVVLPESFPELDARVLLVRQRQRDVVVLDPDEATVDALGVGLMLLRRLRRENPRPENAQMVPVTGFVMTRALSEAGRERIGSALARLSARPVSNLGSLGRGRWIRLRRR